ncbi:MAG TPA: GTPase Era [Anaerolineales bacterium]|nr:GTPase Era [Anaerolineales bacterium]
MPADFKAGFVAVVGKPNVGKSTLMNALLGQQVAAVSAKPQTTRRNQLGILSEQDSQIIFVDTPGLHREHNKLGSLMNEQALFALEDGDVVLFLVDSSQPPTEEDRALAGKVAARRSRRPVLLALNKVDLLGPAEVRGRRAEFETLAPTEKTLEISATQGSGLPDLLAAIRERLPRGEAYYPNDQVTDVFERQIGADLIRAAAMGRLRDEVPFGIDVRIDRYVERGEQGALIEATLFVERESHKGIVIGEGGQMIKEIGKRARKEIEAMSQRKVFLDLRVKVKANWRDDETALEQFGYGRRKDK